MNISGLKYKSKDLPEGVFADKISVVFSSKTGGSSSATSALPVRGYGSLDVQNLKYADNSLPGGKADITSLKLSLNENDARLEGLNAKIGKSDFNLSGRLDNLLGYLLSDGTLNGTLNMRSSLIDVNEWLTTESTSTTESSSASEQNAAAESSAVPANLSLDFAANSAKVLYDKVEMKNVNARARVRDETFTLQSLTADMLEGATSLNGYYSTKDLTPKINFGYDIKSINIMQAVNSMSTTETLAPVFKYMNGKFSAKGDLKGSLLNDLSLDMGSLLANGRVDINNAVISGFPLLQKLAEKFKIKELKTVNISDMWTVFEVKDGRINIDPFDVKFNKISMNVSGSQGIDETVDYDILMDVPKGLLGGANELVNGLLAKNPIPGFNASGLPDLTKFKVKVTNTLADPKIAVNLVGGSGATIKEQVVEQIKEQVKEVKEDVSAKAKELADRILADARQQAQRIRDEARTLGDRTKKEGYAAAKKLEDQTKNPIAKIAAQQAAKKLRQETDDKVNKIIKEADNRAIKLVQDATVRANKLLKTGQ